MRLALNSWLLQQHTRELIGFADLAEYSTKYAIGLSTSKGNVVPLFVFKPEHDWGDNDKTSDKFSWVLYASGIDDRSYYLLFDSRVSAINYAKEFTVDGKVLNPLVEPYKGRLWSQQN